MKIGATYKGLFIWNIGTRIDEIYKTIEKAELPVGESGKERSARMAYGYIFSQQECQAIALHDCDILT